VSWEEIAKLAPIGTLIIASGALCVATWSLLAQKAVARRRKYLEMVDVANFLVRFDINPNGRHWSLLSFRLPRGQFPEPPG
jgi:hypothetical protein